MALGLLAEQDQWRDAPVIQALVDAVPETAWSAVAHSDVFTPGGPNHIPPTYAKALTSLP